MRASTRAIVTISGLAVAASIGTGLALRSGYMAVLDTGVLAARELSASRLAVAHRIAGHLSAFWSSVVGALTLTHSLRHLLGADGRRLMAAVAGVLAFALVGLAFGAEVSGLAGWDGTTLGELDGGRVRAFWRLHARQMAPAWAGMLAATIAVNHQLAAPQMEEG